MKTIFTTKILLLVAFFEVTAQYYGPLPSIASIDSLHFYSDSIFSFPPNEILRTSKSIQTNALRRNDSILYASALNIEAKSRLNTGDLNQSSSLLNEALYIFQKYKNYEGLCQTWLLLAIVDFEKGSDFQALQKLQKSSDVAAAIESPYYQALSEYNIAKINYHQNEFPAAKDRLLKAKTLADKAKAKSALQFAISQQLALVELKFGNVNEANDLLSSARQETVLPEYAYNLAQAKSQYAMIVKDTAEAQQFAQKALEWSQVTNSPFIIVEAQINQSEVYGFLLQNKLSLQSALLSWSIQKTIVHGTSVKLASLRQLSSAYLANGDSTKALASLLMLKSIEDSIHNFELDKFILLAQEPEKIVANKKTTSNADSAALAINQGKKLLSTGDKKMAIGLVALSILAFLIGLVSWGLWFKLKKLKDEQAQLAEQEEQARIEQEKLKESNKKLQELDKNKNKVFSVLTHDIRQPVNQIKSVLDLLEIEELSKTDRIEIVQKLRESIESSSQTLENLLLWSKKQLTGINTKIVDVHLLPQVWQVESQVKTNLDSKGLSLNIHVPDFFKLKADMSQLDICLRNLINNAIKFSNTGGVITIEAIEENENKLIRIIDNGVGMSIDQVDKLKGMTGDFSTLGTMNEKGTGLGVLITREFMENQNGSLDIISRKGEGSVFTLVFPNERRPNKILKKETSENSSN